MSNDFVHLHVHSEYSMLDGLGRVKKLVNEAKRLGQPALALTDHGFMHGAVEFFRACKGAEIKPIIGLEGYQTVWNRPMGGRDPQLDRENYHVLLLAKNMTGYRNLLKIASRSSTQGYYYRPRIDHEFLAQHAEGIICSTGCLGAEVPQLIMQGKETEAYERLGWYAEVFGKENFFIELQEHSIPELIDVNKVLVPWADKFDLQLVATNDVHYVSEDDGTPHDVLLCVQTGARVHEEKRMRLSDMSYFLKSRAQMEETFRPLIDLPASAFDHTLTIADMCDVDLEDPEYHLPDLPIPEGYTYETYLRHLTEEGLARLYGDRANDADVQERKERELRIIHEMGFDVYFLIVADLCDFARSRNIWWNVRGSGAGSLVAYCTGITGLDPLKNNLIFERFLNPGRVTMPDFDLDYPDDQREEMIRYTIEKYGSDQVAQIVTFGRMKARAAIRDVGRAKDVSLAEVDQIAKMIPAIPGKPVTIQDVLTEGHEFYNPELVDLYKKSDQVRDLVDTSMQLEGVARHAGIHAAAVIVADRELEHYTPLMRGTKSSVTDTIAQYEFPILESIGLLKVDFLGLSTLSVMREAGRLIGERHESDFDLSSIPFEGEEAAEAFTLLSSGDVSGVFQVESAGMRRVLTEMKPSMFEHIIATISLYRPGPLEYIPNFIRRMHGEEEVEYHHDTLEPILGETYGICVSGDASIFDAETGKRYRLDELESAVGMHVQGVDARWQASTGRITKWIDSGVKPVYRVRLRNGAEIKVTEDHRLLSEDGWQPLRDLEVGDHIGTPLKLFGPSRENARRVDRRKLRILAFLIADGSLASMAATDFVSKDPVLVEEYQRCLGVFPDVRPSLTLQVRDVVRVGVAKSHDSTDDYHTPNALLAWMRELGMKHAPGHRPGGLRSHEKFVPPFVFELHESDIAFFLASLWECDGHMGRKICHYRTISRQLAVDVQTLLLRIGIRSTIHQSEYERGDGEDDLQASYQVTVYDTRRLANVLQPHMVSHKREAFCTGRSVPTIRRSSFLSEVRAATNNASARSLMQTYGIDRQHFYAGRQDVERITSSVADDLAAQIDLPETEQQLRLDWQEIVDIELVGDEHVYDITVEGLHSFVADNIVVHNCVYQEQIIQILSQLAGYTPGDADLVRRAISKKKASEIERHKQIFIDGCAKNGIPKQASAAIYADIEFFARYGFNKSHAADYAVITVQTAYLKAHYPVEYMAALLLIERDKTEKVVNFINECRRMGIEVLPPDVNYSGLDFEIQEVPDDAERLAHRDPNLAYNFPVPEGSAIRFGMAAVKNVGEGPVRAIIAAREEGGPFATLEEFCERVDLRQVNKRALECLIKVGALDRFGHRSQLLAVLDQMMAHSVELHNARDSGQISMFDLLGDAADATALPINLPKIDEVKGKERLQWEKELLGVYSASHPLMQLNIDVRNIVTCTCNELDERHSGQNVLMVGMIADVRTITTKKGDLMAFVNLEDMQGRCEMVVFPRTFEEHRDKLIQDNVVMVKGKAETRNGQTNLLADSIQTYVEQAVALNDEPPPAHQTEFLADQGPTINGQAVPIIEDDHGQGNETDDKVETVDSTTMTTEPSAGAAAAETNGRHNGSGAQAAASNGSVSPQRNGTRPRGRPAGASPGSGDDDWAPTGEENPFANDVPVWTDEDAPQPPQKKSPPRPEASRAAPAMRAPEKRDTGDTDKPHKTKAGQPTGQNAVQEESADYAPDAEPERAQNGNGHRGANGTTGSNGPNDRNGRNGNRRKPRELCVTFRRSGELDRDMFRLKELYEHIRDPRGRDSFVIVVESRGKPVRLTFPEDPCTISERLTGELAKHFRVDVQVSDAG